MKQIFVCSLLIITVSTLIGCSGTVKGTYSSDKKNAERRIAELENIIISQEAEIEQLKSEMGDDNKEADDDIIRSLRRGKRSCTEIEVNNNEAKIYFCTSMEAVFFLEFSETRAHDDLNLFLGKTGLETGTIEYYTHKRDKIFSISGSTASAETKRY